MASIGSVSCDFVRDDARPPHLQEGLETWVRPGIDGIGARTLGRRGGRFTVRALKIDTAAAIETWLNALAGLAGAAAVIITFDSGTAYSSCYVGGEDGDAVRLTGYRGCIYLGNARIRAEVEVSGFRSG